MKRLIILFLAIFSSITFENGLSFHLGWIMSIFKRVVVVSILMANTAFAEVAFTKSLKYAFGDYIICNKKTREFVVIDKNNYLKLKDFSRFIHSGACGRKNISFDENIPPIFNIAWKHTPEANDHFFISYFGKYVVREYESGQYLLSSEQKQRFYIYAVDSSENDHARGIYNCHGVNQHPWCVSTEKYGWRPVKGFVKEKDFVLTPQDAWLEQQWYFYEISSSQQNE